MSANVKEMESKEVNTREVNSKEINGTIIELQGEKDLYTKKEKENEKQNRKAGVVFAILIVASLIVGLVCGIASDHISAFLKEKNLTEAVGEILTRTIGRVSPFVVILGFVASLIYSVAAYRKCRAKWNAEKDTNEDVFDEVEESLNNILNVVSFSTIISYGFFATGFYYMLYEEFDIFTILFIVSILFFVAHLVYTMVFQQKIVDFVKIMNPEKQGSVYDLKFQDKWYESCDEMERAMIGQCAMKAYRVTQNLCVFLWMFFVLIAMVFEIGLWPVAIVTLIWFVMSFTYMREAKKLTRQNKAGK